MRRGLLLLVLLICSCGSAPPLPSATSPQGIEPEEHTSPLASATLPPSIEPTEYTSPLPNPTPPPGIEAEEYAVYAALIRQNPTGYDLGSFIVIREQTVFDSDMFERTLQEVPDLPAELVDSYRSRGAASYTLGPELDLELDYVLMPQDEFDQILRQKGAVWPDFEARYPGASGLVTFSRVGFGANGDRALALMGYRCHELCGGGGLYLLAKEDGNWTVQGALYEWIS